MTYRFPQGSVELRASAPEFAQGRGQLALEFMLIPHWHIYWINAGDSGAAPKFSWDLGQTSAKVTATHWPVPARIAADGGLTNFGYEHEAIFKFDVAMAGAPAPTRARLKLEFLVCKIECIPYFTELEVLLLGPTAVDPAFARARYPEPAPPAGTRWQILGPAPGGGLRTRLTLPKQLEGARTVEVFPRDGQAFKSSVPKAELGQGASADSLELTLAVQDAARETYGGAKFVVAVDQAAFEIELEAALASPASPLWLVLAWAIVGGLILNVMPCVFPVLSIKILSFMGTSGASAGGAGGADTDEGRAKLRSSGVAYTAGVILSFAGLGGTLLAMRAAGERIGWGFQLQSPSVVIGIALLFYWMGLNFLGTFEIGQSLMRLAARGGSGSFLTGVLATIVATPCTAPFMGAALGASLAMPASATMLVFVGLGLGMASPFLLIACRPSLLRILPRPGRWILTIKELLAFPMLLTVLWLLWVLSFQIGGDGVVATLAILLGAAFVVWLARQLRSERARQALIGAGFVLSFAAIALVPRARPVAAQPAHASDWKPFTAEAVSADRQAGRPVFIDFTAAWCITCQVNKKLVLHADGIQALFKTKGVVLYQADWTDREPRVTQALAQFGRNSLPLYVYYSSHSEQARVLPEILTPGIIQSLFP